MMQSQLCKASLTDDYNAAEEHRRTGITNKTEGTKPMTQRKLKMKKMIWQINEQIANHICLSFRAPPSTRIHSPFILSSAASLAPPTEAVDSHSGIISPLDFIPRSVCLPSPSPLLFSPSFLFLFLHLVTVRLSSHSFPSSPPLPHFPSFPPRSRERGREGDWSSACRKGVRALFNFFSVLPIFILSLLPFNSLQGISFFFFPFSSFHFISLPTLPWFVRFNLT